MNGEIGTVLMAEVEEGILLELLLSAVSKPQPKSGPKEGSCDEAGLGLWITFLLLIEPVGGENPSVRQLNGAGISQVMSAPVIAENDLVPDIPSLAAVLADRCTHSVGLSPVAIRAEDAPVA